MENKKFYILIIVLCSISIISNVIDIILKFI